MRVSACVSFQIFFRIVSVFNFYYKIAKNENFSFLHFFFTLKILFRFLEKMIFFFFVFKLIFVLSETVGWSWIS